MKILITESIILAGSPCDAGTVVDIAQGIALPLVGDGKATTDAVRIAQAEAVAAASAPPPVAESPSTPVS